MGFLTALAGGATAAAEVAKAVAPVAAPVIQGLFSSRNTDKTNQANKDMTADVNATNLQSVQETNATNKAIADQNLAFQREQQEYEKALQQKIFEREDSSYQRTVKDMRQAGLSPLTMNGTNGSGEAIALSPMNNQYQAQAFQAQQAYQQQAKDFGWVSQLSTVGQTLEALKNMRLTNQEKQADIALKLDAIGKGYNPYSNEQDLFNLNKEFQGYVNADKKRQEGYNSFFGFHSGMSDKEKLLTVALKAFGKDYKDVDPQQILKSLKSFSPAEAAISQVEKELAEQKRKEENARREASRKKQVEKAKKDFDRLSEKEKQSMIIRHR